MALFDLDTLDPQSLDVSISELLVATADGYDADMDHRITEVLSLLRRQMDMDVVFVSEFVGGQRLFRFVDSDRHAGEALGPPPVPQAGESGPLEESYCLRVVQGRMPELVRDATVLVEKGTLPAPPIPVGAHLSTPVVLPDGRVYGTVCCFSATAKPDLQAADLTRIKLCARLVARKVDARTRPSFAPTQPDWSLSPLEATPPRR